MNTLQPNDSSTPRETPVLIPGSSEAEQTVDTGDVVRKMLELRDTAGPLLGADLTVRRLREEGRRF